MTPSNSLVHGDQSLLDGLERLSRAPEGCRAVYVSLSRLRPANRTWIRLRIAAHLFAPLVTGYGCEVFLLSNGDLVVVGRDVPASALETQVERLRALFRADPGSRAETPDGRDLFAAAYELEHDGRTLRGRIEAIRQGRVDPWRVIQRTVPTEDRALAPRLLIRVAEALAQLDPQPLIQRQAVVEIDEARRGHLVHEEVFVALAEVRRRCAPDLDLTANRWLFQEVCRLLDRRLTDALARLDRALLPETMALNLNLETVLGDGLDALERALPARTRLVVEVRVIDTFTYLDRLAEAAERLHARGHTLVLDGVTPRTLALLDPARLAVDGLKLVWDPDLADPASVWDGPHPVVLLQALGPDRVVLSHVEDETALLWGLGRGLRRFQGFFVDRVIGATTMTGCPKRALCTLTQCVERRRAAAGPTRASCPNPPRLNAVTELRALPRRLAEMVDPRPEADDG
ncbi:EAL domain-containing protein [Roseospira goensis]|uniref:EAL domain-containing protein (Putative c-di-GMP-specific phosphodiesterase class I) n=1 Tax=Roseospira goensis TaxID=391922 RepID=A0A7W6S169_9PROT|nr:EAL domain-containing protein [Roseospira goensis]MBB4286969.1 EAL domain-containing protein (putative c-di-GMP-specific phosphodiesterase class I) [Roseospira goensis]